MNNANTSTTLRRLASKAVAIGTAATVVLTAACAPGGVGNGGGGDAANYPSRPVELLVPAKPGGGWDQTARGLQQVAQEAKLTDQKIEVINREGGGGATGLAELTNNDKGNPNNLMIGGLVMIGALKQAGSPLSITDATTIATLTSEAEALVVRADSPFQSMSDVINAYKADPKSVVFGGGSAGGSDQILVGLILKAAGLTPGDMNYVGYSGGGEATAGILSGDVKVGVSGVSEFEGQLEGGEMRLLAISSDDEMTVAGKPAPTLKSSGLNVDFVNWRAIFAPPGLDDAQVDGITAFITKIHDTEQWKKLVEERGWTDDFRTGDDAVKFVSQAQDQTGSILGELGL
ncbi:tripartite tricarboxylate transporter substrate-binding protein [Mycolicibacterium septicum]|uniref:Bug family tripartite tricarboxylate transporter substrate binding protein n=1 Tax=Mycolicibacterium septicum TaxID=98668 RepID=UPI0023E26F9F|nr:tripartite tricarboxylate transporter substrate-binding protein [Mycolicibacterium septicum]MDF3339075.1 tripartite tricarboxylate transporter substrate-binding protein [Mycolicibacterium septicum]